MDGSAASSCAVGEAVRFAGEQQARLNLLHVIDIRTLYWGGPETCCAFEIEQGWRAQGRRFLDEALRLACEAGVPAESTIITTDGNPIGEAIAGFARRWQADLIVAGTHGRRGLGRLLLGSVAESIARVSPVSVLLVRKHSLVNAA